MGMEAHTVDPIGTVAQQDLLPLLHAHRRMPRLRKLPAVCLAAQKNPAAIQRQSPAAIITEATDAEDDCLFITVYPTSFSPIFFRPYIL